MNNPLLAYESLRKEHLTGRELEASVLLRAAQKLLRCAESWEHRDSAEFREKLEDALAFNQRLWSFLQIELGNPQNPMPEQLRADLVRLSRFIDQRILELYAGGSERDLRLIARINQQIAVGLQAPYNSTDL